MMCFDKLTFRLFRGNCIICGDATYRELDLCRGCESDLPWSGNSCKTCGLPIEVGFPICGRCILDPPPFCQTICAFSYSFPVDLLIQRFKNQRHLATGRVLATLLAKSAVARLGTSAASRLVTKAANSLAPGPDIIIPTPLHPAKRRQRGFNQSEEIALVASALLNLSINTRCITRDKATKDQKLLTVGERRKNVSSAFNIKENLGGQHVLLIDDVITTGATVLEITRRLLQFGASAVTVMAIARTKPHQSLDPYR